MKRILSCILAVLLLLGLSGCTKELNDENFADFWVDVGKQMRSGEIKNMGDIIKLADDDYGWAEEDMNNYCYELMDDEERADNVIKAVVEKDEDIAFVLGQVLFPLDDERFVQVWQNTYDSRDDEVAYTDALKGYYLIPDDIDGYMSTYAMDDAWQENILKQLGGFLTDAGMKFSVEMMVVRWAAFKALAHSAD